MFPIEYLFFRIAYRQQHNLGPDRISLNLTVMAAYLAEHVPHLQRLHLQLGLPSEALQSDESKIEAAIRNAVTGLIRDREGEVDGWKDAIADVRRSMVSVGRALGEKGRDAVSAARRESENSLEV